MPTTKPRIGVTLPDDLFELVSDVAHQTNRSYSGMVAEIVDDQREALEAIRDSYADEQKMNRELMRRFGERAAMTFAELKNSATAPPTNKRHSRAA